MSTLKRTPLKRKPKARKPKPSTLKNKCDKLAQKRCVSIERCEACEFVGPKVPACNGCLQWCHLKSRRFAILRHDPKNAVCMCAAHHRYFTDHPDLFRDFINQLDPERWDYLNERLRENVKVDYGVLLTALQIEMEAA